MELRTVDPRKLKANPNNPRRTAASLQADVQLLASVQARGIIQPPLVKITGTTGKSVDVLTIDAGHRRVAAAIKAGLKEILVLVEDAADEQALSDPNDSRTRPGSIRPPASRPARKSWRRDAIRRRSLGVGATCRR